MNSDDEMYSAENSDGEGEDEGDDLDADDDYVMTLDQESANAVMKSVASEENELEEGFGHVVLTADQIVQHMTDCIAEVNTVVQVCLGNCYHNTGYKYDTLLLNDLAMWICEVNS